MTPLLPCRPASLSPSWILRFWATYTRTSSLTPGASSSSSSRENTRMPMTLPFSPCGTFSEVSRTSRAFSPKIARSRRSSGVSSVSPFGRDLADQDVARLHLGADPDDAALVEVGQHLLGDVRDVPGDLLGAQLGVAGVDLVLLDVDRRQHVVLHQALREDDRVLVVVALPRHDRDEQVLAQRHLAVLGARPVGDDLPGPRPGRPRRRSASGCCRCPGWSGRNLLQPVGVAGAVVGHHRDVVGAQLLDHTRPSRPPARHRRRPRRAAPCPCRPAATRCAAAAPTGAACWRPSARGWRRRARGTGSSRWRPTPSAAARRRCSRRRPARCSRPRRPCGGPARAPPGSCRRRFSGALACAMTKRSSSSAVR